MNALPLDLRSSWGFEVLSVRQDLSLCWRVARSYVGVLGNNIASKQLQLCAVINELCMSSQNCCPEVGACHLVLIFVPLMLGGFFHLEWFWDECECVVDLKSSSVVVDLERHKVQIWSRSFWHCLKDGVGVLFCCGFLTNSSSASLQPAPRKDELVLRFYLYPVTFFSGAVGFSYWICFLCAYSCLSFLQISCQFEIKITPKLSKLISKIIMTELSFHSFLSSLPNPLSYLKPEETKS